MTTSFPYQQWDNVSLPLIPVGLGNTGTFYAIVDSGANIYLLGREDFFRKFRITFDEKKKVVILNQL